MAFPVTTKLITLVLCFMLIHEFSADCASGCGKAAAALEMQSRKVLSEKRPVVDGWSSKRVEKGPNLIRAELRMAPSGPDPLHHNGSPKKPRTSP